MSTETKRTIKDGKPRTAISTFTQLLSSVQCCFTSTEIVRTVRDGEPRTTTSTFTQLLSSEKMMIMVECCFTSTETVGLLGTGAQDGHVDFNTAPELREDDDK